MTRLIGKIWAAHGNHNPIVRAVIEKGMAHRGAMSPDDVILAIVDSLVDENRRLFQLAIELDARRLRVYSFDGPSPTPQSRVSADDRAWRNFGAFMDREMDRERERRNAVSVAEHRLKAERRLADLLDLHRQINESPPVSGTWLDDS